MNGTLEEALRIRYIKLHFTVEFLEDTEMPADKVSALRGGMGEMLLRSNCVRDRGCKDCDFRGECIVQRTMYTRYEVTPDFVTTNDSVGYILECEDREESFLAGDRLGFNLVLFGKTIVYFNQYMQAFFALGREGVGKNHSRFLIVSVTNTKGKTLVAGDSVYMRHYQIQTIWDYVEYRMGQIQAEGCRNTLQFQAPLTLKYQEGFLEAFHAEAIWNAVRRRIYMLECYEGIEPSIYGCGVPDVLPCPDIVSQRPEKASVRRYSSTQERRMILRGIKGYVQLREIPMDVLPVLLAGELTHIGKNTSFGFGRYRLV